MNGEYAMKKIAGLVIVLSAATLGAYYGMGVLTENTLMENMKSISDTNGVEVTISNYKRNWFTSEAELNWKLKVPAQISQQAKETIPEQNYDIKLPLHIVHGPFIFTNGGLHFGLGYAHSALNLPEQYEKQFKEAFTEASDKPKLDMNILVTYFNKSKVNLNVPSFKLFTKEGNAEFDWHGMENRVNITKEMKNIVGNFLVNGIQFKKEKEGSFSMGKFNIEYDLNKTDSGFVLGTTDVNLDSLHVEDKGKSVFSITTLESTTSTTIENGLFTAHLKASFDKITTKNKVVGPFNIEIAIRNLDAETLINLNNQVSSMQQAPEAARQQMFLTMLPELPKLFSKGPELEIPEMHITMPEGAVKGNSFISLPKQENTNPLELIQNVTGKGKLTIPAAVLKVVLTESIQHKLASQPDLEQTLLEQMQKDTAKTASTTPPSREEIVKMRVEQQLNGITQTGLAVKTGENYVLEFNLEKGQVTVNGKPFTSEMLQF